MRRRAKGYCGGPQRVNKILFFKLPNLFLRYKAIGDTTFTTIESLQLQTNATESEYYNIDSVTDSSHMIYAFNIEEESLTFPLSDSLIASLDEIISEICNIDLIEIDFNLTDDIVDSLETLSFSLVSGIVYTNDSDTTILQENIFINSDNIINLLKRIIYLDSVICFIIICNGIAYP